MSAWISGDNENPGESWDIILNYYYTPGALGIASLELRRESSRAWSNF